MGFIVLFVVIIFVVCCISGSTKDSHPADYIDYETSAAMDNRDYFTDDPAQNYDSYYAQVADDAMMGDEGAIEEMMGEFYEQGVPVC